MPRRPKIAPLAALNVALLLASSGCSSTGGVDVPDWRPSQFADVVLEQLDDNGDGVLDTAELKAAPGLAAGQRGFDGDKDGKITREELQARFQIYREMEVGLTPKTFRIIYRGRPLRKAEVKLVPEFFLQGLLEPADGVTDPMGMVQPGISPQGLARMRVGYYRVEVRSPDGELPAEFNDQTELGVEVSPVADDPSTEGTIQIVLSARR